MLFEQLLDSQPLSFSLCQSACPLTIPLAPLCTDRALRNASSAHVVWERMAGCLEEKMGKRPWSQPSAVELPAPFQALAPRAWRGQAGWLAGQLHAYSSPLSRWAGKVSRLTWASEGSPEVIECCSCPRKGCSKPSMRKSLKPDTGQRLGVILEQELRSLGVAGL